MNFLLTHIQYRPIGIKSAVSLSIRLLTMRVTLPRTTLLRSYKFPWNKVITEAT